MSSVKNLLANPSWDDPSEGIVGWDVKVLSGTVSTSKSTFTRVTRWSLGYAPSTQYSLRVDAAPRSKARIQNINFIPVDIDKDFYCGVYVLVPATLLKLYVMITYFSTGLSPIETHYEFSIPEAGSWRLYSLTSVPPPGAAYASLVIGVFNEDSSYSGTIYFDDAFMYQVTQPYNRVSVSWNNTSGPLTLCPKNTIRIYSIITIPHTSTSTTTSSVLIEPRDNDPEGAIASVPVRAYPEVVHQVYNPPIYNGFRPYWDTPWKIRNVRATGGMLYAIVYFNSAGNWGPGYGLI